MKTYINKLKCLVRGISWTPASTSLSLFYCFNHSVIFFLAKSLTARILARSDRVEEKNETLDPDLD